MIKMLICLGLAAAPLVADMAERERELGTTSAEGKQSHALAALPATFRCDTFRHPPDFVIGVEKVEGTRNAGFAPADGGLDLTAASRKQSASIRSALDHDTLVTHTLGIRRSASGSAIIKPFFDLYHSPGLPAPLARWEASRSAITNLQKEVRRLVSERKATHVILFCAGWHMEQADAVSGAGWMLDSLMAEAARTGTAFRPVTIALTWPAGPREAKIPFVGGLASYSDYPKRSDDADEIGIVWGSRVVEQILLPSAGGAKSIVLGHSLGARLLTSAVASRSLLPAAERASIGKKLDWLIGLQAAFPRDRMIHEADEAPGGSATRGAYAGLLKQTSHALFTTSANDRVVGAPGAPRNLPFGIGRLSPAEHYMGSYMTAEDIPKYPAFTNALSPMWVLKGRWISVPTARDRAIVADCSEIIGSHNDVWGNAELARLILHVIR